MASEINREDSETVAITLRGSVGITTPKADLLNVGGEERDDASVTFACDTVTITLSETELRELRVLLADFEALDGKAC